MNADSLVQQLLFDWESIPSEEYLRLAASLPRRTQRWIGANHPDNRTRKIFFQLSGVAIAEGVVINPGFIAEDGGRNLVSLGERVSVASNVSLLADIDANPKLAESLVDVSTLRSITRREGPIVIENDVWLGAQATLFPGVTIGEYAIVGAGAVVTLDVAARTIVAGAPARKLREISA